MPSHCNLACCVTRHSNRHDARNSRHDDAIPRAARAGWLSETHGSPRRTCHCARRRFSRSDDGGRFLRDHVDRGCRLRGNVAALVPALRASRSRRYCRAGRVRAEAAGCRALCLTVDTPVLGLRNREARSDFRLPPGIAAENLRRLGSLATTSGHHASEKIDRIWQSGDGRFALVERPGLASFPGQSFHWS